MRMRLFRFTLKNHTSLICESASTAEKMKAPMTM